MSNFGVINTLKKKYFELYSEAFTTSVPVDQGRDGSRIVGLLAA